MARGGKESNEKGGGQLTVADYTQRFLERTLENVLADVEGREEKQRLADSNFLNLMHKLQEAGHKDDIRVPLRVLRDEVGKIHFQSGADNRAEKIEVLFKLYDALEAGAQKDARSKDSKVGAAGTQLLEELRQRFSRLVIGDTWDAWPQLKLLALKRMHTYMNLEKEFDRDYASSTPPPTPTSRMGMRKLSRSISGISNPPVGSWQATVEDLGKAPGTRLLPLIKLLLIDCDGLTLTEHELRTNGSFKSRDSLRTKDSLESSNKPPLASQPSGFSEVAETTRRISALEMDDLLGLNQTSHNATTADPFMMGISPQTSSGSHLGAFQQQGIAAPTTNPNRVVHPQHQHPPSRQSGNTVTPKIQVPDRLDSGLVSSSNPGSFNPFDLPSPTYSSRAPAHADNNFADFSPVAGAPHAPSPAPMRAQTSGNMSPRVAVSHSYPQPPISEFGQMR